MKELNKKDVKSFGYKLGYILGVVVVSALVLLIVLLAAAAAAALLRYIF